MIDYRDATAADGPALDAMARASWRATFEHSAAPADVAAYLDEAYGPNGRLLHDLHTGAARFRIAVEDGAVLGYAKLGPCWLDPATVEAGAMQLSQLYVVADRHGAGIGPALMDWTIDIARAAHAPALYLTVWEENARAIRFYERRGFVHVGDYAFRVGAQVDRDLIMRLELLG